MSEVGYDTDVEDTVHMSGAESSGSEDFDEPMQAGGRVRATEIGFGGKTYYEIDLDDPVQGASRSTWQRGNARGMIGPKAEFDRAQKALREEMARKSSTITRLKETVDPVMGRTSLQSQAYAEKLARYRPTRTVNEIDRGEGPSRPGPSRKRPRTVRTPSSSPPPTPPPPIRVRKEINPRLLGRQSVPRTANHAPVAPTLARASTAPQPRTTLTERIIIDLADSSSEVEILDSADEIQILNPLTVAQTLVANNDIILNGRLKRSPSPDFEMLDCPPTPQSTNASNTNINMTNVLPDPDIPMASNASRPPSQPATVVPSPTNEMDIDDDDDDDDPTLVEGNIFDNADEEKPKIIPTFRFVQQREPTIFVLDSDDEKPPRPTKSKANVGGDVSDFDDVEEEFEINALNRQWNENARASGAASITIDARGVKHARFPLPTGFVYLENRYERHGVPALEDNSIPQCSCPRRCEPQQCACQLERSNPKSPFAILSKTNRRAFAYNADGTLKAYAIAKYLSQNRCVVECSRSCDCYKQERGCVNTVAQRRRFPLTIYHTGGRGWGVKTDSRIGKNSALGVMTGELIKRSVPVASKEYLINLEWDYDNEHGPAVPDDEKYMVDCFKYGNWARFINHSCDPNLATYNVMFDCPPKTSPPYAGFYALREIGEGEELTFDYNGGIDPNEIEDQTRLDGAMPCLCGAVNCRKRII
ncbi:SET domain-containing protein [Cylindrobasidium torrendii FP15055 ss-10]|uniref:SET domain-containing protein n=1 Tax=Cylindrobasidium torrendii FP15055 ss-10 TaxID=1314674 RepID=A0A0D7BA77_9AGAR|nr:SET domain-containing protein [Cylindrobasidium torrendii FP15055 ss-10]